MLCFFGRGVPELQNQNCGIRSPSDVDSTILCGSAAIFRYGKKTVIPDEDLKSKGGLHELAGQDAFGMFRSLAFEPHHTQQTKQNKQNKSKQRNAESAEKYLYLKKQPFPPQEKKTTKSTSSCEFRVSVRKPQISCRQRSWSKGGKCPAPNWVASYLHQRWALWNLGKPIDFYGFFT